MKIQKPLQKCTPLVVSQCHEFNHKDQCQQCQIVGRTIQESGRCINGLTFPKLDNIYKTTAEILKTVATMEEVQSRDRSKIVRLQD